MAKTPRKGATTVAHKQSYSQKGNPNFYKARTKRPGKTLKAYQGAKRSRRLSIVSSTSESSKGKASDLDSSLTALSDDEVFKGRRRGRKTVSKKYATKLIRYNRAEMSDDDLIAEIRDEARKMAVAESESSEDDEDVSESSSDDDGVDFVKLQAQKRTEQQKAQKVPQEPEKPQPTPKPKPKPKRRASFRRPSAVALPEDLNLNFKFEFDDLKDAAVEEEELGEEVGALEAPAATALEPVLNVPRIKEDELNTDDEYEFDDNDLLATLQADNDMEDFIADPAPPADLTYNEDDTEDHFLREEEKYLVNEFETHGFSNEMYHDEEDDDFIDFDMPYFDEPVAQRAQDDDSYLFNYFLSSGELDGEIVDVEEQLMLEALVREQNPHPDLENDYDSESTDVDDSLPPAGRSKVGSKMAKEVLSLKTADYRPPVLGTWVAIRQPFGIIDGLATRSLGHHPRKNWHIGEELDDPIELDELLNISELDNDDENDVRIWRDFSRKQKVPLGAFRNKLHLNPPAVPLPMVGFSTLKMNTDFLPRKRRERRRRASVDAKSEGFRPTKSGLFSEHVLADVEEVAGDDRDVMALIKGLY